jgi:hypothetical protein
MFDEAARNTMEALLTCQPATADRAELERIVTTCSHVKSLVAAVEVVVARRARQMSSTYA